MEKHAKKNRGGKKQRVTLKDISRASGVALSTVSNALAGKPNVREDTRQLVLRAAKEFGYRTSPVARSLRTGRTFSIGLLVSDITNTYYAEVVRGAETALRAHGYFLMVVNTDYEADIEEKYVQHFLDQQVDGIILVMHSALSESVAQIKTAGVPLLLLNRRHAKIVDDLVGVDFRAGTQMALQYLWNLGHREIGFLTGKSESSVTEDRLEEVERFRRSVAPDKLRIHIARADYSVEAGQAFALDLLTSAPATTAIMTSQDQSAFGCLAALSTLGLSAPQDCSILGFDDLPLSASPLIDLTTLRVERRKLGEMAASLLLSKIDASPTATTTQLLSPELIIRGTCAAPRSGISHEEETNDHD